MLPQSPLLFYIEEIMGILRFRSILAIVLISACSSVFAACEQPLRIGVTANYPPMVFKQDERLAGIEIDLSRELQRLLECKLVYVELPFEQLLSALQTDKVDIIMAGLSITDSRKQSVSFAKPYMSLGQMAIIRKDSLTLHNKHPAAILAEGITAGYEEGSTGERFVERYRDTVELKGYPSAEVGLKKLQQREIDIFIHDAPTSWRLASSRDHLDLISMYKLLTREDIAWAVSPSKPELLVELNNGLDTMRTSGRLGDIISRWIPVTVEVENTGF
ncbi:putative histidine-binding protein [Sinobacterium norvegicum]|uniref:Histidine-binding protein n=1 Tax=Sinobacterium norvegicum TaxID=1641715 RepID=A0ABM9AK67_9GAMM|nr:ABC transporter substrate-binding protein [Sinobacterium norvegicum]CAH0993416.1 putative histidine-binding protein [Sinobacterium norvegicum]